MRARAQRTAQAVLAFLVLGAGVWAVRVGGQSTARKATAQEAAPGVQVVGQTAAEAIRSHETATQGPEQPIPFSHRFHVTELLMDCLYCHAGSERSEVAVVPALELCIGCHRVIGNELEPILRLREYWERGEPVPWVRVYKLPEFVQFPHRSHLRNAIPCQECHGQVEQMDRVYRANSLRMGWCLECHFGEPQEGDVATDHVLVGRFPPPEIPPERQPASLYPRRLEQRYAETRAPIDCFACHY